MDWNKRKLICAAGLILLTTGLFVGCGSNSSGPGLPQKGSLYTFVQDSPICDVLAFRTTVSGLSLRIKGTTEVNYTLFPTASLAPQIKVNWPSLLDTGTILNLSAVNEGTYDQVQLRFTGNQIVVYDPTRDPPVRTITGILANDSPTATLQTDLTIVRNTLSVLQTDFDMQRTIVRDAQGNITGNITPAFSVTPVTPNQADGFGFFDDLLGFVTSVSASPTGQSFTGSFNIQLISGSGPTLSVSLTNQTDMYGVPDLASLETGRIVEVGGFVDDKGNLVARTIEAEDRADVENKLGAFIGYVLPTPSRDASGNVTQFKLYIREEEPDVSSQIPLDSVINVNVSPSTYFQISSRPTDFANLTFDASGLVTGQEVIVHGAYTVLVGQTDFVNANSIYLKVQTLQGALTSLVQVGSDGKSGAFWLAPCAMLQQGGPVLVLTTNNTVYVNASGLAGIFPQALIRVRGLPFYQPQATTIRGISVPAGTLVVTARQVNQIP